MAGSIGEAADQVREHVEAANGDTKAIESEAPADEQPVEQPVENTFQITVRLPHSPHKTQTIVSTQDQVQDIRQSIIDLPHTFQYSCYHLERNGQRIPEFVDLSEIPDISPDVDLTLVEDPYTEKDARIHVLRIRELIGAAGDRTDLVQGMQAGISLHDHVLASDMDADAATTTTKSTKTPSAETHAMSAYDVASPGAVTTLLPPVQVPAAKPIKSISLSPWNPPTHILRSKGHLLYLQITTNESEQFQITSHVSGFYVNKSSNSKFDPTPRTIPKPYSAHSLLTLISKLSTSFDASFKTLQEWTGRRNPLSSYQLSNALPASPWVVSPSLTALSAHVADPCRSQESYLLAGAENTETLRDWNEEFQTTRELPKETVQDRVFRERVTSKLFADYNEAATQGAVLIARGEVAPLNPTENKDAQIFVYNNVFYSFGADGVGTFANEGGDEAARVATGKDVTGVRAVNQLDIQNLSTPGTVVVDYMGKRLVGQSIVPGIFKQREPGEQQIDYGGVEGKDVVAENEAFVPLFKKLSAAMKVKKHAVWDKEGKRHDLEASIETKGLLGTDGRKYVLDLYRITPLDIGWIEKHWIEPEQGAAPSSEGASYPHRMTVLRPELVDTYWRMKLREYIKMQAAQAPTSSDPPVGNDSVANSHTNGESTTGDADGYKGGAEEAGMTETEKDEGENDAIVQDGPEESKTNKDVEKTDQIVSNGAEHGPKGEAEEEPKQAEPDRIDISGFHLTLNPDVFSGQKPQSEEEKENWGKDEAEVRTVSNFLVNTVIPDLIRDLRSGDVGFPMDGQSLSALLHKRGINIRYLGKIVELSAGTEPRLQALRMLATQEMITRAFKHITNRYLRYLPAPFASACVAHLLNCLVGHDINESPKAEIEKSLRVLYSEASLDFEKVTPENLQAEINVQVKLRYRIDIEEDWTAQLKHLQMLREVCLKLGIQLTAKDYNFSKSTMPNPSTNGHPSSAEDHQHTSSATTPATTGNKKKKKAVDQNGSNTTTTPEASNLQTFYADDILNIVPIIKEAAPRSVLATEALEAGRISIGQQQRELGIELLLESLSLHEQIYGILHAEVARVYYQLSTHFYNLDDKAIAVELARKAVIVAERTLGVDSHETVLSYLNLGLFEHASGNTRLALTYVRHALDLLKVVYGARHPDSITTINNVAVMLQHLKLYHDSRLWFETSLAVSQDVSGRTSVNTATLLFQLAQALALDQDSKGAVGRMREAYNIFNAELGAQDRNTREAETWLEQLTQNAVSIAKHAKDVQARRLRRINQLTPRVTLATRMQPQAGQSSVGDDAAGTIADAATEAAVAAAGAAAGSGRPLGGLDERSIDELLRYIEGSDASKQTTPKKRTTNPKRRQQQPA